MVQVVWHRFQFPRPGVSQPSEGYQGGMDVIDVLIEDHRKAQELFEALGIAVGDRTALARQLASLNSREDVSELGPVTPEEVAALEDAGLVDENGEPINRSLLLKFLSSVRT